MSSYVRSYVASSTSYVRVAMILQYVRTVRGTSVRFGDKCVLMGSITAKERPKNVQNAFFGPLSPDHLEYLGHETRLTPSVWVGREDGGILLTIRCV